MVRWEADGRERLAKAALELYSKQGFDETTVAEIAQSAGLTERTFFRHFADKREALFGGQDQFVQGFIDGVALAPHSASPFDVAATAVLVGSKPFTAERRPHSLQRQKILNAHSELRERELLKLAGLAHALASALIARDVGEPAASLAAESGVVVFRVSWDQWLAEGNTRSLVDLERDAFAELGTLVMVSRKP
ncbi:MAG: TetR family transcriptional regulator [Pseudolysinimonas sp.]|uniref:TetR family transcriptional regulator n=1 Tax=Pseudolysinimonas sp. TaxID=2680009 RepID=UPI0032650D14